MPGKCRRLAVHTGLLLAALAADPAIASVATPPSPPAERLPAPAAPAAGWMPLEVGVELTYAITGHMTTSVDGKPGTPQPLEATETERVVRDGDRFRLETRIVLKSGGKETAPATRTVTLSAGEKGVYLHGHVLESPPAERVDYDPPLVLLQLPARPGSRWTVGTYRSHDLRMAQEAEILDFEDVVTPAGKFRHCLKVRYTSPLTGTIQFQGKNLKVDRGDVQYVEWFAIGVGNVKQVATYQQTFTVPGGASGSASEVRTRVLARRRKDGGR